MNEFCTCGARLPDDARFCHKCGKPQFEEDIVREPVRDITPVAVTDTVAIPREIGFHNVLAVRIAFFMALISTVAIELLAPYLLGVVFLFTGLLAGGCAAAYIYSKKSRQTLSMRNGLRMGWITGIFCFVIFLVTTTIKCIAVSLDKGLSQFFRDELTSYPGRTADMDQLIKLLQTTEGLGAFLVVLVVVMFILFTLLPTIGGAIGAKISDRN